MGRYVMSQRSMTSRHTGLTVIWQASFGRSSLVATPMERSWWETLLESSHEAWRLKRERTGSLMRSDKVLTSIKYWSLGSFRVLITTTLQPTYGHEVSTLSLAVD